MPNIIVIGEVLAERYILRNKTKRGKGTPFLSSQKEDKVRHPEIVVFTRLVDTHRTQNIIVYIYIYLSQ